MKINRHQYMPGMNEDEFRALKESILEHGVLNPVLKDRRGNILEGHHRDMAWQELVAEGHDLAQYPVRVVKERFTAEEERTFVRSVNMVRRHLTRAQKRRLVEDQLHDTPDWANRRIAAALGVSHKLVKTVREELEAAGELERCEVLIRGDGRKHVRSNNTAWQRDEDDAPEIETAIEQPIIIEGREVQVKKEDASEARDDTNGSHALAALCEAEVIDMTEVIDIMVRGGLKVCEHNIARHESGAYRMPPEVTRAHVKRWNEVRARIRAWGKASRQLIKEREFSHV